MSRELRDLNRQLALCHQHAASLLKQSKPGQWESNQAAIRRIEKQIQFQQNPCDQREVALASMKAEQDQTKHNNGK